MKSFPRYSFLILLLGSALTGCASNPDDSAIGHTFGISIEDGVTIARSSAIPRYEDELFTYERIVVLQEDEREESLLVRGSPPSVDARGWFYVPDSSPSDYLSTSRIVVYDSTGVFRYAFGQPGEGPGDMKHPDILGFKESTIEMYDPHLRRISRFTVEGNLVDIVTIPISGWSRWRRLPDDLFVTMRNTRNVNFLEGIDVTTNQRIRTTAVATAYSSEWDSLWSIRSEPITGGLPVQWQQGEMTMGMYSTVAFDPSPVIDYRKELGFVITTGREPVLDIYTVDGQHRLRIEIDLPVQPVTPEDIWRFEKPYHQKIAEARGGQREFEKRRLENLEFPEYMAFWGESGSRDIHLDDSGYIWITIPTWSMDPDLNEESAVFCRIINPDGEYLGITRLPIDRDARIRLTRGLLTMRRLDSDTGEITIAAYRIRPAVSGLHYP